MASMGDGPTSSTKFQRLSDPSTSADAGQHSASVDTAVGLLEATAADFGLEVFRNWAHASEESRQFDGLLFDPWQPRLNHVVPGSYPGATGSTHGRVNLWRFSRGSLSVRRRFSWLGQGPEPVVKFLVISCVTWHFRETKDYSTSLIARCEGVGKRPQDDAFLMRIGKELFAKVTDSIFKKHGPTAESIGLRNAVANQRPAD